jgi:hypothetical protein
MRPNDITAVLQRALGELQSQRMKLDRQIAALRLVLDGDGAKAPNDASVPRRKRRMSAAARRALGLRMKAYWAKRRESLKSPASTKTGKERSSRAKKG